MLVSQNIWFNFVILKDFYTYFWGKDVIYKFLQFLCLLICAIYLQLFFLKYHDLCSLFIAFYRKPDAIYNRLLKFIFYLGSTIPDNLFRTKYKNPGKLDKTRILWYCFLCVFWPLLPKFYFYKGDWAFFKKIDIFLMPGS